jgi:regulator of sirC expression with transglutaminase-like and TPR domain
VDFRAFAAEPDEKLDLLTGALLIARDAYPGLDLEVQTRRMDQLAAPLVELRLQDVRITERSQKIADYLYRDCGFRGNTSDYYDPRNSFLNDVLERRVGIPISLAIVYIEVARRAGVSVHGVGFPGHFLVRLDDATHNEALLADPFSGGAALDRDALERLLLQGAPTPRKLDSSMLAPASTRQILARILMNLRGIYAARGDYARLLLVLDRIIDLLPEVANEVRDRGLLWAKLGAPRAALDDLERYVEMLPNAGDVAEVQRLIAQLERSSGPAN